VESVGVAATVTAVEFIGNEAQGLDASAGFGGAWVQKDAPLTINGGTFSGNRAGYGGALYGLDVEATWMQGVSLDDNTAGYGGAVFLNGAGAATLIRNTFRRNDAPGGAAVMAIGNGDTATDEGLLFANNLVDGQGLPTGAAIGIDNKAAWVRHNNLVRYAGPAVVVAAAEVELGQNLIGFSAEPVLAIFGDAAQFSAYDNAWWRTIEIASSPITTGDGREIPLGPGSFLDNPRVFGGVDGELPDRALQLAAFHPRPSSPMLLKGYPATSDQAHVGIFGGPYQYLVHWENDLDGDDVPWIFDCNDASKQIGDRLVQWLDEDGDGVGGIPWAGDECTLVAGHVLVGGDCDDADASRWDLCGQPTGIAFYGSSCASLSGTPTGAPLALGALVLLLALRRRERSGNPD
jgi:MYXO-CTERM domain-containing protein